MLSKNAENLNYNRRLPGYLPGNRKIPASWGFLLLLFPWVGNFILIASATQLLNREHIVIREQVKSSSIADVVIPVKKISKNTPGAPLYMFLILTLQ